MDRRGVLVAAAAFLTGCSSFRQSGSGAAARTEARTTTEVLTETATPTPAGESTKTESPYQPEKARSAIRAAQTHLSEAARTFETELNRVNYASRSPTFDDEPIRAAIEEARTSLWEAEQVATPKQQDTIAGLTEYVGVFEKLLNVMDPVVNSMRARPKGVAFEEEYDTATKRLDRARSELDEVRVQLERARVRFRTARKTLDDPAVVPLETAKNILDKFDKLVGDFETLYAGDRKLKQGWDDYKTGQEYFGYSYLSASSFEKAVQHFAKANYIYGKRAASLPAEISKLNRTIEVVTDGSKVASYTIAVDGELMGTSTNSDDSVEGSTATGKVSNESDRYAFSGTITKFEVDGEATVYVDGQQVDPATISSLDGTSDPTNTIVISGTGSRSEYQFTVSHALEPNPKKGGMGGPDTIEGTTAKGAVGGGDDAYDYAGVITEFSLTGDAKVYINGEQVDPSTLAPDPNLGFGLRLGRLFRRRQCLSSNYRTAAEKMRTATLLDDNSPEKAEKFVSQARDAMNDEDPCSD